MSVPISLPSLYYFRHNKKGEAAMIFDMGNRLGAGAVVLALTVLMGCQAKEEATSAAADASVEAEPATLGSMDEQYAWVGDLGDRDALPGKPLYIEHCAGCHEAQVYKAPHTTWLELMSPQVLYRSITEGIMQSQAAHLSDGETAHRRVHHADEAR
jgi:mono/diheme cytochrome c family protein